MNEEFNPTPYYYGYLDLKGMGEEQLRRFAAWAKEKLKRHERTHPEEWSGDCDDCDYLDVIAGLAEQELRARQQEKPAWITGDQ